MTTHKEYSDRAKSLRQHPMVLAWIKDYQGDDKFKKSYPDCHHCTYPHAPNFLCGSGSTFGQLWIGRDLYYVDWSNVCFFVDFRSKPRVGFHWRNDTYFQRLEDGSVKVTHFSQYNNSPQERSWKIPAAEWASIVCSVSALGETGERWNAAQDFHGRLPADGGSEHDN